MAKGWGIVQDSQGNAIEDCEVKVYEAGTSTLASIFSDSALSVAIDQVNSPVTTDATGHYQFFIVGGTTVKIIGTKGTFTFTEDNVDVGFSVPAARSISTDPPLTGGGDLSADRTLGFDAFEDVRAHGAVGNNVADDTAAIQAAIDAVEAAGGGVVFFPVPTVKYKILSDLTIDSDNVILRGAGFGSFLNLVSCRIHVDGSAGLLTGFTMENLQIRRSGTDGDAVSLTGAGSGTGVSRYRFHRVKIQGVGGAAGSRAGVCVHVTRGVIGTFEDCWFFETGIGLQVEPDPSDSTPSPEVTLIGGDITDCDTAVSGEDLRGFRAVGTTFQNCDTIGVDIFGNSWAIGFFGARFENNAGHELRLGNSGTGAKGVTVSGCLFSGGAKAHAVTLIRAKGVAVTGNQFSNVTAEGIDLQEASAGDVEGYSESNVADNGVVALNGARQWNQASDMFAGSAIPAAGATKYGSMTRNDVIAENTAVILAPFDGFARTLQAEKTTAPGAGESLVVTFRVANSASPLTATISDTGTSSEDVTNIAEFSKGDRLALQFVASNNGSYSSNQARASCELVRTDK